MTVQSRLVPMINWLRRRAENVAAFLLTTIFVTFLLQITFRYVLNWPVGWTLEVSTLAWMWLVLWGSAFVVRDDEEIRFDIVYGAVSQRIRRRFIALSSIVFAVLLLISIPAVFDYVTFMKVERVSYFGIRYDFVFSIYIVFMCALIVRYLLRAWRAVRAPESAPMQSPYPDDQ